MIIVIKEGTEAEKMEALQEELRTQGVEVDVSRGKRKTLLGLIGNTSRINQSHVKSLDFVEQVIRIDEPYTRASRAFHPEDTVVTLANGTQIGGKKLTVMAGPCSVETPEQMTTLAAHMRKTGAAVMRGGAFKPRTSPYSFQGLKETGLEMLCRAARKEKLPVVTEIMSADKLDVFLQQDVDIIQIGARNMQNFELLRAVGKTRKPILLKRGLSATIEEWLMAAEYIMAGGNSNVILCERGIRTYETYTRNTLDLSAVLAVKRQSHLPIIVDPSHATGKRWMVPALAKAAIVAGADGIMVEVHNNPSEALCDGEESITPDMFDELMQSLRQLAPICGREL